MPDTTLSVFISYSRTDTDFVDRLEADLQARSVGTWVDRRKLEGGQDWLDMIQEAIEQCHVMLVVLSPEAVASKYVKLEYRQAWNENKLIIPLQYRPCDKVPIIFNSLQWINFTADYTDGLNNLLLALIHQRPIHTQPHKQISHLTLAQVDRIEVREADLAKPQPARPALTLDLDEVYRAGLHAMDEGDLEHTVILWQQILEHDPSFQNGTFAPQYERMMRQLHPRRVQRLRERAEQASQMGEWGQEIGAWEALLALEPQDEQAKKRLLLAKHNQKHAWHYENARKFLNEQKISLARSELQTLWDDAPYYGDPANLSDLVGMRPRLQEPSNVDTHSIEDVINLIERSIPLPPLPAWGEIPQRPPAKQLRHRPISESASPIKPIIATRRTNESDLFRPSPSSATQHQASSRGSAIAPSTNVAGRLPTHRRLPTQPKQTTNYTPTEFISGSLRTTPFMVWLSLFCLATGLGSLVGVLTQQWYWAIVVAMSTTILAYFLGYRKAMTISTALRIAALADVAASGSNWYVSTLRPIPPTEPSQLYFGLLAGVPAFLLVLSVALFMVFMGANNLVPLVMGEVDILLKLGFLLLLDVGTWLLVAVVVLFLHGNFGFAAGWDISLIGLDISLINTIGLGNSIGVFWVASRNQSKHPRPRN